jgi:hypothetical protein
MPIVHTVEHRPQFTVVRADGEPGLAEFLAFVERLGGECRQWPVPRLLVDLRGIRTLTSFTEHYAVGEAVGRHMGHLRRIASVVPADRITRASEKTAQRAGVNMAVFTSEAEAIEWLNAATFL